MLGRASPHCRPRPSWRDAVCILRGRAGRRPAENRRQERRSRPRRGGARRGCSAHRRAGVPRPKQRCRRTAWISRAAGGRPARLVRAGRMGEGDQIDPGRHSLPATIGAALDSATGVQSSCEPYEARSCVRPGPTYSTGSPLSIAESRQAAAQRSWTVNVRDASLGGGRPASVRGEPGSGAQRAPRRPPRRERERRPAHRGRTATPRRHLRAWRPPSAEPAALRRRGRAAPRRKRR